MPEPGALQVAATAPQPVEMPEPGALQVAATTPEPAALMQLAVASAPDPAPAADPAPATSESPFIRINEIVPLGRPVATPLHGGYFRARLAGYASRERTVEFRREIERQVPELRDSMRVVKERPSLALGARLRYTLVTAPLPSRRAAEDACDTLAERGVACLAEPAASPLTLRS
jgi:hypothetical protein